MHPTSRFALSILVPLALCAAALPPARSAERVVEYVDAHWFDGERFVHGSRRVAGGRFVGKDGTEAPSERVDLGGGFVVPPFGEAHNHNLQNAWGLENNRAMYLREGVFYAAMLCGDATSNAGVRAGLRPAGDVRVALTACISSADGHPLGMALASLREEDPDADATAVHDQAYVVVESEADVAAKWPLVRAARPDLVKLILVHSEDPARREDPRYHGFNGLRPELVAPLVARAHADGLRVVAHTESAADFAVAVAAGVDIVAHLPGYAFARGKGPDDYRLSDEAIAEAARRGVTVVPTASVASFIARDPDAISDVLALQRENLRRLKEAGVPLAMGSDRFTATSLVEYEHLAGTGLFAPEELLRMLSMTTPQLIFPDDGVGCLEPGCRADFLVLDRDPLADAAAVRDVRARVMGGLHLDPDDAATE